MTDTKPRAKSQEPPLEAVKDHIARSIPGQRWIVDLVIDRLAEYGYAVVPREPTEKMLDAPWRAPDVQLYEPTDLSQVLDCVSFAAVWRAMIEAAPK